MSLEAENSQLRQRVAELEARLSRYEAANNPLFAPNDLPSLPSLSPSKPLDNDEIFRYGRQLILSEFGIDGSSVPIPRRINWFRVL